MILTRLLAVFIATTCFSLIFNAPKKELLYCGFVGLCSWLIYDVFRMYMSEAFTIFLVTAVATYISRQLSFIRRSPITAYLLAGIIPLVPGAMFYNSMYGILGEDVIEALSTGVEAIKISGAIAIGIMVVLSLPAKIFYRKKRG